MRNCDCVGECTCNNFDALILALQDEYNHLYDSYVAILEAIYAAVGADETESVGDVMEKFIALIELNKSL